MPLISYPSVNIGRHPDETEDTILTLPVDRTDLRLETPDRVVHENPETRDIVAVNRGPSIWFLTLTFGAVETETDLHREFEHWLARMHDLRNFSHIPLGSRALGKSLVLPVTPGGANPPFSFPVVTNLQIETVTANTMKLNTALRVTDTAGDTLGTTPPIGTYLLINNRLAMLESVNDITETVSGTEGDQDGDNDQPNHRGGGQLRECGPVGLVPSDG